MMTVLSDDRPTAASGSTAAPSNPQGNIEQPADSSVPAAVGGSNPFMNTAVPQAPAFVVPSINQLWTLPLGATGTTRPIRIGEFNFPPAPRVKKTMLIPRGSVAQVLTGPPTTDLDPWTGSNPGQRVDSSGSMRAAMSSVTSLADSSVPAAVGGSTAAASPLAMSPVLGSYAYVPHVPTPVDTTEIGRWLIREPVGKVALCSWITEHPNTEESNIVGMHGNTGILGRALGSLDEHGLASELRKARQSLSIIDGVSTDAVDSAEVDEIFREGDVATLANVAKRNPDHLDRQAKLEKMGRSKRSEQRS